MSRAATLVLLAALTTACGNQSATGNASTAAPLDVQAATVQVREVPHDLRLVGSLVAQEDVAVSPEIGGTVVELPADFGDRIERGALLLRLDAAELTLRTAAEGSRAMVRLGARRAPTGSVAEKSYASAKMWPASGVRNARRSVASPLSQSRQSPPFESTPRPQCAPERPAEITPNGKSASPYARLMRSASSGERCVVVADGMPSGAEPSARLSSMSARTLTASIWPGAYTATSVRRRMSQCVSVCAVGSASDTGKRSCPDGVGPRSRSRLVSASPRVRRYPFRTTSAFWRGTMSCPMSVKPVARASCAAHRIATTSRARFIACRLSARRPWRLWRPCRRAGGRPPRERATDRGWTRPSPRSWGSGRTAGRR